MAYSTGTAIDIDDLLLKIKTEIEAHTTLVVEKYVAEGVGYELYVRLSTVSGVVLKTTTSSVGGVYVAESSPAKAILLQHYGAFDTNQAWDSQPDSAPGYGTSNDMETYNFSYSIFTGNTYMHVIAEIVPGIFKHIAIGAPSTETGVPFHSYAAIVTWENNPSYADNPDHSYHSYPFNARVGAGFNQFLRVDIDGATTWAQFSTNTAAAEGSYAISSVRSWARPASEPILYSLPAFLCSLLTTTGGSSRPHPIPIVVLVKDPLSGLWYPAGTIDDMFWINMEELNPGESFKIGMNTYIGFPVIRKNGEIDTPSSGTYGMAYRINQ